MSGYLPLEGNEALVYRGETLEFSRVYFTEGLVNAPVRVWESDSAELHYRPKTMGLAVIDLESGERNWAKITGKDEDSLLVEESNTIH